MGFHDKSSLHPLTTHWHNRSLSSVVSDAATFHSAKAHQSPMELSRLESPLPNIDLTSTPRPLSPQNLTSSLSKVSPPSPKLESFAMGRQDSGFAEGRYSTSSRRTSTSSRRHKSPSKRTSLSRPSTQRAPRSSPTTAYAPSTISSYRPCLRTRHTAPTAPFEYFQFPTLPSSQFPEVVETIPPPPPATCQYWTSDANRRLEYAAIDAASRGVRGFFIKLVPDCMLPPSSRRTRFHCDDSDSDAGSVRRYRLALPDERPQVRPGILKRWTSFGKKSARAGENS
jgi:hypothetical protein